MPTKCAYLHDVIVCCMMPTRKEVGQDGWPIQAAETTTYQVSNPKPPGGKKLSFPQTWTLDYENKRSYNETTQYSMWTDSEVSTMDYKARIIMMVERINNESILKRIHNFVSLWYAKA